MLISRPVTLLVGSLAVVLGLSSHQPVVAAPAAPAPVAAAASAAVRDLPDPVEVPQSEIRGDHDGPVPERPTQAAGKPGDERHEAVADALDAVGELGEQPATPIQAPAAVAEGREAIAELRADGELAGVVLPGTKEHDRLVAGIEPLELSEVSSGPALPVSVSSDPGPSTARQDPPSSRAAVAAAAPAACAGSPICASYSSSLTINPAPTYNSFGAEYVQVTNWGTRNWAQGEVRLGYHLYRTNGDLISFNNAFTPVPATTKNGGSWQIRAQIGWLPSGSFKLVWDLHISTPDYVNKYFTQLAPPVPAQSEVFTLPYTPPAGSYSFPFAENQTIDTLTPELKIVVRHDFTKTVQARFEVCAGSFDCTTSDWTGLTSTSPQNYVGYAVWNVPVRTLHWNTQYTFRFQLRSGTTEYGWERASRNNAIHFITVVPQPANQRLGSDESALDAQGVNLYLGQYVKSETGLSLPAPLGPVGVSRTYNSADLANRAYGAGWSSMLDSSWTQAADGQSIVVQLPDGRARRYAYDPSGSGSWAGGYGDPEKPKVLPATRELVMKGVRYAFDLTTGRLSKIQYDKGQILLLHSANGVIDWIEDVTSRRRVYLAWSGGRVVAESTGPGQTGYVWRYGYSGNQLTSVCDARGAGSCTTYQYGGVGGRMSKATAPGGTNPIELYYRDDATVMDLVRPGGSWRYTRTVPAGGIDDLKQTLVVKVTDARTNTFYGYDSRGALLYKHDNGDYGLPGNRVAYVVNELGQLEEEVDQNGNLTEYRYDLTYGKVIWIRRSRDGDRQLSKTFTYIAETETSNRNLHGLLRDITPRGDRCAPVEPGDPCVTRNRSTTYEYLPLGMLAAEHKPVGLNQTATTRYTYTCNNDGNNGSPPLPVNDPTAGPNDRQPCGLLVSETDPAGLVTSYSYNRWGDRTRVTTPGGQVTDMVYNQWGELTSQTVTSPESPQGATTTFGYDNVGNLRSEHQDAVVNPVTGQSHRSYTFHDYDAAGNLVQSSAYGQTGGTTSGSRITTYGYDAQNRQTSVTEDGIVTSRTTYNVFGQPTKVTDGNFNSHFFEYWPTGQLKRETAKLAPPPWSDFPAERDVVIKSMAYDAAGRLASSTDRMGQRTYYRYSPDDLLLEEYTFTAGTNRRITRHLYEYDDGGNVVADSTVAGGQTRRTQMTYDDANARLSSTFDPGGLNRRTRYEYDAAGRVVGGSLSDGTRTESTRQVYGPDGQVLKQEVENGATDLTTQYDYDAYGNLIAQTDPRGAAAIGSSAAPDAAYTTSRTYDALGRLSSDTSAPTAVEDGSGSTATTARGVTTYGYNAFGEATEVRDPSGAVTRYAYDGQGRRISESRPPVGGSYSATVQADGPIAWWPLGDTGTTVSDKLGARSGTYTNNGAGRALVDGASAYDNGAKASRFATEQGTWASIPNTNLPLLSNHGTVEAWFRFPMELSGDSSTPYLLKFGDQFAVSASADVNGYDLSVSGTRGNLSARLPRDATAWHHLVLSFSPSATQLFVDGVRRAGVSTPSGPQVSPASLIIGSGSYYGTSYADGVWGAAIQHVAVYGPNKDPQQIARHYRAAQGDTTTWTYDWAGNPITETDPQGNTTETVYDTLNRPIRVTDASGGTSTYEYDDNDNLVSSVDPSGSQVLRKYDEFARLVEVTQVERVPTVQQLTTRFTYDDLGNLTSQRDVTTGVTTTWTHNLAGEVLTETTTGVGTTTRTYDLAGRVVTERAPAPVGTLTTATYDLAGRPTKVRTASADGTVARESSRSYDGAGNVVSTTDARGNVWTSEYDARNQPVRLTDPVPQTASGQSLPAPTMSFGYDARGLRTRITDGNGRATYTRYNARGLPVATVVPATAPHSTAAQRTWTVDYDSRGLPVREAAPNGAVVTSTYDVLGRLTGQTGTGGAVNTSRTLGYDASGRVTSADEPGGTATFAYNDRGLLVASTHQGVAGAQVTDQYSYDALGRPLASTDAAGSLTYAYDGPLLGSVTDSLSGTKHTYQYDAAGRRTAEVDMVGQQAGMTRRWTYDPLGRAASDATYGPSGAETGRVAYTWDLNDNLLSQTGTGQLQSAHSDLAHTYDEADRLVSTYDVRSGSGTDFRWDGAGNRTSSTPWTGTPASKSTGQATSYSYDERNRITSAILPNEETDYTYDAAGNLVRTVRTLDPGPETTITTAFDAFGRLVSDSSSGTGRYTYDGLDRMIGSTTGTGRLTYGGLGREPVAGPGGWAVARTADGAPLTQRAATGALASAVVQSVHGDVLATVSTSTGATQSTRTYEPFGAVTGSSGTGGPIGWQGSLTDPGSGRTHADARWYEPSTGQFLSQDTAPGAISSVSSWNLYGYGSANPATASDPTGHWSLWGAAQSAWDGITDGAQYALVAGSRYVQSPVVQRTALQIGKQLLVRAGAAALTASPLGIAVLAAGGAAYVGYQLYQSPGTTSTSPSYGYDPLTGEPIPTLNQPTPSTTVPTSPTTPTQTVQQPRPEPYKSVQVRGTPVVEKDRKRWFDSQNVYIQVTTTITTMVTTFVHWTDGSVREGGTKPDIDTLPPKLRKIPIINLKDSAAAKVVSAVLSRVPLIQSMASSNGACGQGGSLDTCVQQPLPPNATAPGAPQPAPLPGGAGSGARPPTTTEGPSCSPDPSRGPIQEGDVGRYGDLRRPSPERTGDGLDLNHMPQADFIKSFGILKADGGVMALRAEDHRRTRTYGRGASGDTGRSFKDVLLDDYDDLRGLGLCFDLEGSIDQMTDFWTDKGLL